MNASLSTTARSESASAADTIDVSALVVESTASKIRTFLYEIAEGTSNYRSLHSLTQQVEHQYHGRFLVELIQNAHDALHPEVGIDHGRIAILLDDKEGPHGALYVANDGRPFNSSNFASLSQLGQSDKNPQESIGNKGIGFRSVLEISESPEIFSRRVPSSSEFDGLCFRFTPEVLTLLAAPMDALAQEGHSPVASPFSNAPLVDWDPKLLAKFRRAIARHEPGWLAIERSYLSPYLLPIPLDRSAAPATVTGIEAAGFATLVRLPLKTPEALSLVRKKMRELPANMTLFLDRVRSLVLDDGESRRHLTRRAAANPESTRGQQEIQIATDGGAAEERYRIWSRTMRVEECSAEFREGIRQLPGKWPELREARVSIAVRLGDDPDTGTFSVFLPTLLRTGSATHVNAPFFADMSRTLIDFDQGYNKGLLDTAWQLAVDVVRSELAGKNEIEAQMIADLLASLDDDEAGKRWRAGIASRVQEISPNALAEEAWFLSQSGWSPLNETSLYRPLPGAVIFTDSTLREHATFEVFHNCVNTRSRQLERLSQAAGFSVYPLVQSLAETAEVIAQAIHNSSRADWNAFWSELRVLMQDNAEPLKKRKILLGRDGALHSAGEECAVFFVPRRGVGDDDELAADSAIIEIPPKLQPHVAFLHDSITLYDENNRRTVIRKFLEDVLVKRFRVEDIFTEVLIPRTPVLPVRLKRAGSALCADILQWGLRLLSNLADRGIGERTIELLKKLPLPCVGGWFRADSAAYGPGWLRSHGDVLERYLTGVGSADCKEAAKRLLLAPDQPEWGSDAVTYARLLNAAGVFDGLRLSVVQPDTWNSTFIGASGSFSLPETAPPGFPASLWERYRNNSRAQAVLSYSGEYQYQMQAFVTVPGLTHYDHFDHPTRVAFMELILASACKWPTGWNSVNCRKMSGWHSVVSFHSPLWFVLNQVKWLGFGSAKSVEWSSPPERWHVPAKVLGARTWQFDHLHPLPAGIAHRLDADPRLSAVLADLGMPQYDLETASGDARLLNALAAAAESDEIRDTNVFLGQVRSAWGNFTPAAVRAFPRKLLVHRDKRLLAVTPSTEHPVYIPDSARSFVSSLDRFGVSVLAIEPADARRLATAFVSAYRDAVVLTSTLRVLAVADGGIWTEGDTQSLHETEFDWVIEVALTLAAYGGLQPRGTGSARFAAQVLAFRGVLAMTCTTVSAHLHAGDKIFEQPDLAAMWIADRNTLLIADRSREDPALLSEALAAILERDDLVVSLKLALREAGRQPNPEDVIRALSALDLTESQYLEVCEHWQGNLRNITDRLLPLLTILRPNENLSPLSVARSEQQVRDYLASLQNPSVEVDALLAMARETDNAFDFGLACYRQYGPDLQLDRWNSALKLLGERPIKNANAVTDFEEHASRVIPAMRSLLAAVLRIQQSTDSARTLIAGLESIACPEHYCLSRWEMQFVDAMDPFAEFFKRMSTPPKVLALLQGVKSYDALVHGMRNIGIDPLFDPIEAARRNRERLRAMVLQLQEIGLAWAVGVSGAIASLWESRVDSYIEVLDSALATAAYLVLWSEEEVFALLCDLPRDPESQAFWTALDSCTNLEELKCRLGIGDERLLGARKDLAAWSERARRESRIVSVCGREFDSSEDNRVALWSHIASGMPDDAVAALDHINLDEPTNLLPPPRRKPSGQGTSGGYSFAGSSKIDENLVGLAGEIYAFRRLQQQYGALGFSASSWISSNALHVYADNVSFVDDGAGCDFRFTMDRKMYHLEVKSSNGTDEMFTLGSSEIRLAMELSKSRRSRRESEFLILRVLHALSDQPIFQVLPNPYDERYRSYYDIVEAGARIRYNIDNSRPVFTL